MTCARYEALEVRSKSGSAKISGTLLSLTGAMMLTFYKGASLTHLHHHLPPSSAAAAGVEEQHRSAVRWVLGSASMLANVVGFAGWLLLQRRLTRLYPAVYSATALMSPPGGSAAPSRSPPSCTAGVVASGVGYLLLTYCVEKRGPVFTAAFSPLAQMFVAGIDLCVLHEPLYLGSVLGSVLVILGLYLVLWGKREEAAVAAAAAAPAKRVEVAAAGHGDVAEQQERV
ncbi:unnamed protein product [Triticum turgidum subsp. durum]|uniref:WAT1-related protein n=1 Tax=Triticum turgidum subsp. durum TaxID=4567 RepID=A0A9R0Z189_TRITD|nr:unnamed protein product [Triticum turgidum subsp. durum]